MQERIYESYSREDTLKLGTEMGKNALPGQVICLDGDLGTGKTVFAQGMGHGLGILEPISSPTFTILKEYDEGRIPFYHFDVYRIEDEDEMEEVGFFDKIDGGDGVCLIEWAEMIENILPPEAIRILVEKDLEKGFDYRKITIKEQEKK